MRYRCGDCGGDPCILEMPVPHGYAKWPDTCPKDEKHEARWEVIP
jgi:hypothetical protein